MENVSYLEEPSFKIKNARSIIAAGRRRLRAAVVVSFASVFDFIW
jgi:hypothetical protein